MKLDELIKELQNYKKKFGANFNPEVKMDVDLNLHSIDVVLIEEKEDIIVLW